MEAGLPFTGDKRAGDIFAQLSVEEIDEIGEFLKAEGIVEHKARPAPRPHSIVARPQAIVVRPIPCLADQAICLRPHCRAAKSPAHARSTLARPSRW